MKQLFRIFSKKNIRQNRNQDTSTSINQMLLHEQGIERNKKKRGAGRKLNIDFSEKTSINERK